ncbi:MAG: hypothetical protein LBV29_00015 [Azoarcus sp.]|nr:hypothetical protein [Azoarcus sp.]
MFDRKIELSDWATTERLGLLGSLCRALLAGRVAKTAILSSENERAIFHERLASSVVIASAPKMACRGNNCGGVCHSEPGQIRA